MKFSKPIAALVADLVLTSSNIDSTQRLIDDNPGVDIFTDQRDRYIERIGELRFQILRSMRATVIGIDPAMIDSGWSVLTADRCSYGVVNGVENIAVDFIASDIADEGPIFVLIEYPTWRGHGAEQVRAAANCWIRTLQARFPGRCRITKVTPQTWMSRMIPGYVKADRPASLYVPLALKLIGSDGLIDENAAAAVALCYLATTLLTTGRWSKDLRVGKKEGVVNGR